jgi:glycerate kinase
MGIDAVFSILNRPRTLEDAILETETLLAEAAEQAVRLMLATRSVLRP